jgi:hypothetical protein
MSSTSQLPLALQSDLICNSGVRKTRPDLDLNRYRADTTTIAIDYSASLTLQSPLITATFTHEYLSVFGSDIW